MRKTNFYSYLGLYDVRAIADSKPSVASNLGNINLIKQNIDTQNYATLEQDFFLLDGSKQEMPDTITDIAYQSLEISDSTGDFANVPTLTVDFNEIHTSYGLTFHFMDDYPLLIEISWYQIDGTIIYKKQYEINSLDVFVQHQVENYGKIEVKFIKANPYRYIKLRYLEYGTTLVIGKDGIQTKDGKLVESIDPISAKIAINQLSFKMIDESEEFNIGNFDGMHKSLQKGQEIEAYETLDEENYYLGKFYLKKFSVSKNLATLTAESIITYLDSYEYREGGLLNGVKAGVVIDGIMSACGVSDYTIDDYTYNFKLYGYIGIMTCKKALQQVLQVVGSVADCSRSSGINIYQYTRKAVNVIKRERKFSTTVSIKDYITDITVKYNTYSKDSDISELSKGTYNKGTYTIDYKNPCEVTTVENATLVIATSTYAIIKVTTDKSEVIVKGYKYTSTTMSVTASLDNIYKLKRKEKTVSTTVANYATAIAMAQRILDYYQLTLSLKIKFLSENDALSWSNVENSNKEFQGFIAGVEKITTDLSSGYIANAQLSGYYDIADHFYRTTEIYTGDEIGDL